MNGKDTAYVYTLLNELTERLILVTAQQPEVDDVGRALLEALRAGVSSAVGDAVPAVESLGDDAETLDGLLSLNLGVPASLEALLELEAQLDAPWWIEAAKGIIKQVKHLLPIPPKLVSLIDEILELINKILNWGKDSKPGPKAKPQPPAPQPPPPKRPVKEITARSFRELWDEIDKLPEHPIGDECQMIKEKYPIWRGWRNTCVGHCPHGEKCRLVISGPPEGGIFPITMRCSCR